MYVKFILVGLRWMLSAVSLPVHVNMTIEEMSAICRAKRILQCCLASIWLLRPGAWRNGGLLSWRWIDGYRGSVLEADTPVRLSTWGVTAVDWCGCRLTVVCVLGVAWLLTLQGALTICWGLVSLLLALLVQLDDVAMLGDLLKGGKKW